MISRMGNRCLPKIVLCARSPLSLPTEGHQKSDSVTALKGFLVPVASTIVTENSDDWRITTNHVVLSFENISRAAFKDKRRKRRNHSAMP